MLAVLVFGALPAQAQDPLRARIDAAIAAESGPVEVCSDADFVRRVYLDLVGVIPSGDEARAFLDDPSADKRAQLVEQLLADPRWARQMASVLDVMLMERRSDTHVKSPEWQAYLYQSLSAGKPLNELAREILSADGADPAQRAPARFYLDREGETNLLTRDISRVFFGRDLQCAQCHDHPLIDDYLQTEYYGLFAFLSRTYVFRDRKAHLSMLAEKADGEANFQSVFDDTAKGTMVPKLPGGMPITEPMLPPDQQYVVEPTNDVRAQPKFSRRGLLAAEATSGQNDAFNRNWANRLWAHMMGRGLVEPLDLHHPDNPPSHPELMATLAQELVVLKFDIKAYLRELALSNTYQRRFELPNDWTARAKAAGERLATAQSEVARLKAEVAQPAQALAAIEEPLKSAAAALQPVSQEFTKATSDYLSVKKPADEAALALSAAQQALVAKQQAIAAVSAALTKTNEALALVKEDPELKAAADKIAARATQLTTEATTMEKTAAEKAAAAKVAAEKVVAAQTPLGEFAAKMRAARESVDALFRQQTDVFAVLRAKQVAAEGAEARTKVYEAAARVTQLAVVAEASLAAATKAESELTAAQQSSQQLAAKLAETQQLLTLQSGDDDAAKAKKSELEKQIADITAAQQTATAQATAIAPPAQAAREKANADQAALAAARDELAELWSTRFVVRSLKPLSPEQLAWSVLQVSGQVEAQRAAITAELDKKEPLDDAAKADPAKRAVRAKQIEEQVYARLAGNVGTFVELFGAAAGQPQHDFFATVDQALFLANAPAMQSWLAPQGNNTLARATQQTEPVKLAEELYLGILARRPTDIETAAVSKYLEARAAERPAALQELAWGLVTSAEFRFNH